MLSEIIQCTTGRWHLCSKAASGTWHGRGHHREDSHISKVVGPNELCGPFQLVEAYDPQQNGFKISPCLCYLFGHAYILASTRQKPAAAQDRSQNTVWDQQQHVTQTTRPLQCPSKNVSLRMENDAHCAWCAERAVTSVLSLDCHHSPAELDVTFVSLLHTIKPRFRKVRCLTQKPLPLCQTHRCV